MNGEASIAFEWDGDVLVILGQVRSVEYRSHDIDSPGSVEVTLDLVVRREDIGVFKDRSLDTLPKEVAWPDVEATRM